MNLFPDEAQLQNKLHLKFYEKKESFRNRGSINLKKRHGQTLTFSIAQTKLKG